MKSLRNSVQLLGRLGKDPEVRTFDNGNSIATFTMATTDSYKNQKGEKVEDTQWHNVVVSGKLTEIASKYLKKGHEIMVEGRLVHRSYETSGGEKRFITEVTVNELLMLSKPKEKAEVSE